MVTIPVEDFEQHCSNNHMSRDAEFEAEYEVRTCMPFTNFISVERKFIDISLSHWPLDHLQCMKCLRCSATSRRTDLQIFTHVSKHCQVRVSFQHCMFADDDSRVVLKEIPGLLGSDYINASWINVNEFQYFTFTYPLPCCLYRVTSILMHTWHPKVMQLMRRVEVSKISIRRTKFVDSDRFLENGVAVQSDTHCNGDWTIRRWQGE